METSLQQWGLLQNMSAYKTNTAEEVVAEQTGQTVQDLFYKDRACPSKPRARRCPAEQTADPVILGAGCHKNEGVVPLEGYSRSLIAR